MGGKERNVKTIKQRAIEVGQSPSTCTAERVLRELVEEIAAAFDTNYMNCLSGTNTVSTANVGAEIRRRFLGKPTCPTCGKELS